MVVRVADERAQEGVIIPFCAAALAITARLPLLLMQAPE